LPAVFLGLYGFPAQNNGIDKCDGDKLKKMFCFQLHQQHQLHLLSIEFCDQKEKKGFQSEK
jgi:hypothetical protein